MSAKAFIDTNVLVYLFDTREPAKQKRAAQLLEDLTAANEAPVLSTQVLQETFLALTRKLHLEPGDALAVLQMTDTASFTIQSVDAPLLWRAAARVIKDKLTFWDALILEAALEADCTVLYSEDFQSNRSFGALTVVNPFLDR